nr:hypothetical protein [Cellvibrio japonicus]
MQAFFNFLERLEANQWFMMPLTWLHVPLGNGDITCINRVHQYVCNLLGANVTAVCFRELRLRFQKAFHLGLNLEPTRRKSFQCLADNRCLRLFGNQQFAVAPDVFIVIADRGLENPVPIHHPCPHAVFNLLTVFLALVLRHAGQQVFNQLRIRIITKFNRGRFQSGPKAGNGRTQPRVRVQASCQPGNIIDDHHHRLFAMTA